MKNLFIAIAVLVISTSCRDKEYTTIVEGTVVNLGTQKPLEGVKVFMENEVSFYPGKLDSTITDKNGFFRIELMNEDGAWLYLQMNDYVFYPRGLTNSIGSLTYYSSGSINTVKLEMYPYARFKPVFMSSHPSSDDTLYFHSLGYAFSGNKLNYGGGGGRMYDGASPYDYGGRNGSLIRGDVYYRFGLNFKKDGEWFVKIDSIIADAHEIYTDTIYY